MRCAGCGTENQGAAKFCMECGTKLVTTSQSEEIADAYVRMPNWLVANIAIVALSFFLGVPIALIPGTMGIGFAAQVNGYALCGHRKEAKHNADWAMYLFWAAVIVAALALWIGHSTRR